MSVFSLRVGPGDGVAWVTGASSGIGRALALRLVKDGWTVYATSRGASGLADLAAEAPPGRILPMPGDVTDAARMREIVAAIEAAHPLALAVLNAGIYTPMRAQEFDAAEAGRMVEVNLTGTMNALDPVLEAMIARRTGHVAVMASVAGYRGLPGAGPYSASKAGLIALCESLAMDLVDLGVRLTVVNPGFVETEATSVNAFEMPFLMQPGEAAERIVEGLRRPGFALAFPRRFSAILRLIGLLPSRAYIATVRKATGWKDV